VVAPLLVIVRLGKKRKTIILALIKSYCAQVDKNDDFENFVGVSF